MRNKKDLMDYIAGPARCSRTHTVEPIELKTGTSLSVQASKFHYCSPKQNDGPWESFEVGISHKDFFRDKNWFHDEDWGFQLVAEDFWIASNVSWKKIMDFIKMCGVKKS